LQRRARRRPCTITSQRYALLWPWRRCKFLAGHPKPAARTSMRHYVNTLISTAVVGRICSDGATYLRKRCVAQSDCGGTAQNLLATTSTAQRAQWVPRRVDMCPRGHMRRRQWACRRSTPNVTSVDNFRWLCTAHHASPPPYRWSCRHAHTAVAHTSRNPGRSWHRSEGDALLWTRARTRLSDLHSCTGPTIVADCRLGPSDTSAPTRTHHACLECRACRPVSFQGLGPADRF
jgi:hypothetical protein